MCVRYLPELHSMLQTDYPLLWQRSVAFVFDTISEDASCLGVCYIPMGFLQAVHCACAGGRTGIARAPKNEFLCLPFLELILSSKPSSNETKQPKSMPHVLKSNLDDAQRHQGLRT